MFTYGIPLDPWLFQGLEGYRMVLQELVVLVVFIEELLNLLVVSLGICQDIKEI